MSTNGFSTAPDSSRRKAIAGIAASAALIAGSLMVGSKISAQSQESSTTKMPVKTDNSKRTSLHQEIDLAASPQRIYEILLSSKDFATFSGAPAKIDPTPGGAFSLFGERIVGRNVELVAHQRIVQAWCAIGDWPPGVYTLVKFELMSPPSGTRLVLDQTGFFEGDFDHLDSGWHSHYWEPLKKFLAQFPG